MVEMFNSGIQIKDLSYKQFLNQIYFQLLTWICFELSYMVARMILDADHLSETIACQPFYIKFC